MASRVVLMEPWWAPAIEEQAWDRVHRMGQKASKVEVVRFVMKKTIEERLLAIQEKKKALGVGALSRLSAEQLRKMRLDDLDDLFSDSFA
eukprot:CAMPEP_0201534408 /NCGR_PEP_ID=MMETSP0161_2-20130828/56134_1 /ASSEMBLY_ACC=CAM_ASM_000251 /TAXON_ID=180227 /ORGANISM="Neoparamoeba aestuarina, Strain SoJaBio B1-5/56/2" /LENGTH=89 /DNA_ID=CAMNT_0047939009 /DNA_START=255 /DNA_END=521 /DNA_ORIENTATION=-